MDRVLFDPAFGYYADGTVRFGAKAHFETFPRKLSPFFGRMIAEAAGRAFTELLARGLVPAGAPLTLLEVGAGDGELAASALDWIAARRRLSPWKQIHERLQYVILEVSPALRHRQRHRLWAHLQAGRAVVRQGDVRSLQWQEPFHGVIVANEVLSSLPVEVLEIESARDTSRIHVESATLTSKQASLWRAIAASKRGEAAPALVPRAIPLTDGWRDKCGWRGKVPDSLAAYLRRLQPLIRDLEAMGRLPTRLCWPPACADVVAGIAGLLLGPGCCGAALIIDYGGSSRHALDSHPTASQLRVYGGRVRSQGVREALADPGSRDITCDIDFSELGQLAVAAGLEVSFYGQQAALEKPPIDLWSREAQKIFIDRQRSEGVASSSARVIAAHEDVIRFRRLPFWLMMLTGPGLELAGAYSSAAIPWRGAAALATPRPDVSTARVAEALRKVGAPSDGAPHLRVGSDPQRALLALRLDKRQRRNFLELVADQRWLAEPGELAAGATGDDRELRNRGSAGPQADS